MIKGKGVLKPYVKCIGHSAIGVTQSCYYVRYQKFAILLDTGIYQEADVLTNYKTNKDFLKKIKAREIDYVILNHVHQDHCGMVPALYAKGCQAHLIVPKGSKPFLKLLWQDSLKILQSDCLKITNKHGIPASPFYTEEDIDNTLNRIIEVDREMILTQGLKLNYYGANHIIHAKQLVLTMGEGCHVKRLGFTGDIGGKETSLYTDARETLPMVDVLLSENTYNQPKRINKAYDRQKDLEKLETIINERHRVLIPCFSLSRTQIMITVLKQLYDEGKIQNIPVVIDSPLAQKICNIWPGKDWEEVMKWKNLVFLNDMEETYSWQKNGQPCVIISASGFLSGGKILNWLQAELPNKTTHICFCGYSGENNLASQIRSKQKTVVVNGVEVENNANITELVSFSSHASYEELLDYLLECRYNKVALVHGDNRYKPQFAQTLQNILIEQGKSARVICVNEDTKIVI